MMLQYKRVVEVESTVEVGLRSPLCFERSTVDIACMCINRIEDTSFWQALLCTCTLNPQLGSGTRLAPTSFPNYILKYVMGSGVSWF